MLLADLGPYKGYEGAALGAGARESGEGARGPVSAPAAGHGGRELLGEELGQPQITEPGAWIALPLDRDPGAAAANLDALPAGRVRELGEHRGDGLRGGTPGPNPAVSRLRLE